MIAAVIARLEASVADLVGRIEGAAELADLMQNNRLPQVTPAAHVIPMGCVGGSIWPPRAHSPKRSAKPSGFF